MRLPDIVAYLKGQFRVTLVGKVDLVKGRLRTTFANVPDAPVSKFTMNLYGGKQGLLVNSENLCKGKQRAKASFIGQNGRRYDTRPVVATSCGKGKGAKSKKGR